MYVAAMITADVNMLPHSALLIFMVVALIEGERGRRETLVLHLPRACFKSSST